MVTTKLFQYERSQAVRLPKEFRFDGTEVYIKKIGNAVVLLPIENSWNVLVSSLALFPNDFMETGNNRKDKPARTHLYEIPAGHEPLHLRYPGGIIFGESHFD